MVSKHLKHINNLKNLKVENVKALLKDSLIREGSFLEMNENCTPANGEAIDKALAAHSRKPAVTSATNIKEKSSVQKSYEQDKKYGNENKQICSYLTD